MPWKALYLVMEDRGKISVSRRNGLPVYGQHLPYWAGLLVEDTQTGQRSFLDSYNAEILLNHYLQPGTPVILPMQLLLADHPDIRQKIGAIICRDTDAWQEHHQINRPPRNAALMKTMAASLTLDARNPFIRNEP